jgi:6-phosphogluconolactonase
MAKASKSVVWNTCEDTAAATAACAALISQSLTEAQAQRNGQRLGFMVSGGRSPRAVLKQVLAATDLDWGRITLCASDERLVPARDPASTEGMVREVFRAAAKPLDYCSFGSNLAPDAALAEWCEALQRMVWPVTVAFLGIGEDGHIASLFPDRPESGDADLWAAAVPATRPHLHPRLTLGARALLQAQTTVLIAAGAAKRAQITAAMSPGANPETLPATWLAKARALEIFVA